MTTLPTRQLGRSGLELSVVGLGCNNFGRPGTFTETQAGTTAVLEAAIDAGVTFFDTADMYGGHPGMSEEYMGVALRGQRDKIILATKFGHSAIELGLADGAHKGSRPYIRAAVTQSLRRLQTDYLDLYQLHTPDPVTPIEETIGALRELVAEGTIRSFGHSNFDATQLIDAEEVAAETAGPRCESSQNELSLLVRGAERDILPLVTKYGMGFLPYFPLYNGLFTGKFGRTERPADSRIARQRPHLADEAPWDTIEAFEDFCADRGTGMLAATFAWLLSREGVTSVIAGATRPEQVRQNAEAALAWKPTEAELAEISRLFSDPS